MQKSELQAIIKKYYLDGITGLNDATNVVGWEVKDKSLNIQYLPPNASVRISIDANLDLEDGKFGIFRTDKLLQMVNALDSEFDITFNYVKNRVVGLRFDDKSITATYGIADPSILTPVPAIRENPEYNIQIDLTREIIKKFTSAKKALPDAKIVALFPDGSEVDFIVNYDKNNSNTVTIPIIAKQIATSEPIMFDFSTLIAIFNSNLEFKLAICNVHVAERGRMELKFINEDCISTYLIKPLTMD